MKYMCFVFSLTKIIPLSHFISLEILDVSNNCLSGKLKTNVCVCLSKNLPNISFQMRQSCLITLHTIFITDISRIPRNRKNLNSVFRDSLSSQYKIDIIDTNQVNRRKT